VPARHGAAGVSSEAFKVAELIVQRFGGRDFVLLVVGEPGESSRIISNDMTEAELLDLLREVVGELERGAVVQTKRRRVPRRPDA
jgi:hypothetical protein